MKARTRLGLFPGMPGRAPASILQMNFTAAASAESPAAFLKQQLISELPELLKKYQGHEIEVKSMPDFQRNGAELYTQKGIFASTDILLTLQEDLAQTQEVYETHFKGEKGASFTLYLFWTLLQAMNRVPAFNYRYINGRWYQFDNLPLFTTMAGAKGELNNVVLEEVAHCSWPEFCRNACTAKEKLMSSTGTAMYSYPVYASAHHLTNVRFNFTALSIPVPKKGLELERPMFVLGARQEKLTGMTLPLGVKLPHASLHPQLLDELLMEWRKLRNVKPLKSEAQAVPAPLKAKL